MKHLLLILLFPMVAMAGLNADKIVLNATSRNRDGDCLAFKVGAETVKIDCVRGGMDLGKVTAQDAALAFLQWAKSLSEAKSAHTPITHVGFPYKAGMIRLNLKDGTIRWPKVAVMEESTRTFLDEVSANCLSCEP